MSKSVVPSNTAMILRFSFYANENYSIFFTDLTTNEIGWYASEKVRLDVEKKH